MKNALIAVCLLLGASTVVAQKAPETKPTHTGVWWHAKSGLVHEAFVNGFKSGEHKAFGHDTNLTPFGTEELVAGLDHFYKDFRNQNIGFNDAIDFVADQLRGVPDDKLNAELLKMRAAAAKPSSEE